MNIEPKRTGRPPMTAARAAVRLAWHTDPCTPRAELARIGNVSRGTIQRWLAEFKAEDPTSDREWLALVRARVGAIIERALGKTLEGMDDLSADKAWQVVASALKTAGLDAPERKQEVKRIEFVVRRNEDLKYDVGE